MFSINMNNILQAKIFTQTPASVEKDTSKKSIYSEFQLPITYLDANYKHALSDVVSSDLELNSNSTDTNMYEHLLKPKHKFATDMISNWNKEFTTNIGFLNDSQKVLKNMPIYLEKMRNSTNANYCVNCDNIMQIWKDTKEDPNFLEKYSYMDWNMFKHLNHSQTFLQTLSIINMTSPLLSFIIPFIFLIFPFVLLKIQRIPITFSMYLQVLKDIAKHHFIGKTIANIQSLSWDKLIYVLFTAGLYFLQIYQNINQCIRFYTNINKINAHLCHIRDYLKYSIASMENFVSINQNIPHYTEFCNKTREHSTKLSYLYKELENIKSFKPGFSKIVEIGYLLKCFYQLHSNVEYENSLKYSFGFEGFINNLTGIHENISSGFISYASFDTTSKTKFKQQYYPPYIGKEHVKNDCDLSMNMIITGPNASGKTTALKTTTLNIVFSQQFGCGFYSSCVLNPYTHIHSYLNIPDTSGRDSLFQAESRRCKEIIDIIDVENGEHTQSRHFCIFDELYSGTNPIEATKSAYAFLLYLSKRENVDFILTTHYVSICKKLKRSSKIQNYKMLIDLSGGTNNVKYTYKMKKGISKIQGAILILEEMNYPKEIINEIRYNGG